MSTIDELIDRWIPEKKFVQDGSFKVRRTYWDEGYYFMPYYLASYWHGLDSDGDNIHYKHDANDFEIYEEPKVKHWIYCDPKTKLVSTHLYADNDERSNDGWIKIPGTEVEL